MCPVRVRVRWPASSPALGRLRRLNLEDNGIGDGGARALAFDDNPISEETRAVLRQRFGKGLA